MQLGQLLLQDKRITADQLAEALEAQVVQGGRLGTNLVELGYLTEEELAKALGRQHGMPYAFGEIQPDPAALALVDPKVADSKDVVPLRVDATRMSLGVMDPRDLATHDLIAFKSGKRVIPVVVPELRIDILLRRHYRALRPPRGIEVQARASKPASAPKAGPAQDLMSEEAFQTLYAEKTVPRAPAPAAPPPSAPSAAQRTPVPFAPAVPAPPPPSAAFFPAAPSTPRAPPAAAAPSPLEPFRTPVPYAPAVLPSAALPEPELELEIVLDASMEVESAAVATPEPLGADVLPEPLTFAQAQAALAQSADREAVATNVLRFALSKFKRALLLSVHRQVVVGWRAMGQAVGERRMRALAIPLDRPSTFKLVLDTRSHFIGPVRDVDGGAFYPLLGAGPPTTAVMMPLLARGKVVHLLYVDAGPGVFTPPDVGELLILSQSVSRSYEALIRQRLGR